MNKISKSNNFFQMAVIGVPAFLLFVLFLYAAYAKLSIYSIFVEQLNESPITQDFKDVLAWLVPSLEILLAISLIFKKTRLIGFYGSFFLMLLFTVYVFIIPHFFSGRVPCACGGIISALSWKGHFYFNLTFTLLAGIGLVAHSFRLQKEHISHQ